MPADDKIWTQVLSVATTKIRQANNMRCIIENEGWIRNNIT
jgi:hypothetical protein